MHTLVGPEATAYVIDPTRSGDVAVDILGFDYAGTRIHDGWSPYDRFHEASHQQCLRHLLRRADEMGDAITARGGIGQISAMPSRPKQADWIALGITVAVCAAAVVLEIPLGR